MPQHPTVPNVYYEPTPRGAAVRCTTCGAGGLLRPGATVHDFARDHLHHYGAGDAIAAATGALGVKPCTPCEARRNAMNRWLPRLFRR